MNKFIFLTVVLMNALSVAQVAYTSFEEPLTFNINYTDTGDPSVAHDLLNNMDEPLVDYVSTGGEIGYNARYEPYDSPGDGLADGDAVGVNAEPPTITSPYTDGIQGYQISDVDGNFILEFDPVLISSPSISIDYFITETGYEGDGTSNSSGSDRLRIYVKDLNDNVEYDLLNTTGNDINDLSLEGVWNTADLSIEDSPNITIQLIIEARNNSGVETFYFDNIRFQGLLNTIDIAKDQFFIYPNPTTDGFINIVSKAKGVKEIIIYDVLGEQRIHTTLLHERLSLNDLNSGIYFVKIVQGTSSTIQKLIVK